VKPTAHRFSAKAPPLRFTPEAAERFAATVFDLADKAIAADAALWAHVAELARAGDSLEILRLAEMRRTTAPEDILASLRKGAA
jgi:hypothetical protein